MFADRPDKFISGTQINLIKFDTEEAEAERFYNYPYNALEEALVNAVFHKVYRDGEPVEIRIYVDCIQILNYPGPDKWISMENRTYLIVTIRIRDGFEKKDKMSESKSELEKGRIIIILDYLKQNGNMGSTAADILDVHVKTASRLLKQAVKLDC